MARVLVALALLACLPPPARGEDALPYPVGDSTQAFESVGFDLRIPEGFAADTSHGLVLIEPGSIADLDALAAEPYVIVRPFRAADPGALWNAGDVKVIGKLVGHLVEDLVLDPARVHAVAVGSTSLHGIFEMLVFRKRSPFVSATYVRSTPLRSSVASDLKRRMGVLGYDWQPGTQDGKGMKDFVDQFERKVRVVELRSDPEPLQDAYFVYWLHVMGGGFVPGHDRSLAWRDDVPKAVAEVAATLAARGTGGLVYVFDREADAENPHARALQNDVFFDRALRAQAARAVCFKLDRAACPDLVAALGVTETPAVVVLDPAGQVAKAFAGKVKASALAKAVKKVVPKE